MSKFLLMAVFLAYTCGATNTKPVNPNAARVISTERIQGAVDGIYITTICRSGVVYLVSYEHRGGGITPAYNPDGTLRTCK